MRKLCVTGSGRDEKKTQRNLSKLYDLISRGKAPGEQTRTGTQNLHTVQYTGKNGETGVKSVV